MRVKRIEKVDKNCRRNKMFPVYEQKKENVHILQKTSRHAPPHLHNSVEFIYVISGSMEIGMGQELFHMDEGDFAVIFPDVIHHYQVFEKGKNKSIYVWALPVITSNYMDTLQNLCPVDPVIKRQTTFKLIWRDYANGVCGIIFRENFFPIFGRRKSSLFFKNPAKIKRILISNNI